MNMKDILLSLRLMEDSGPEPHHLYEAQQLIDQCMAQMTVAEREVKELLVQGVNSTKSIAEHIRCSESTARRRARRVREIVQKHLQRLPESSDD